MPGMYAEGEYDIAGFTVGVADEDKLITGVSVQPGDVLIGIASSGVHSNGFSLVRKVLLADHGMSLDQHVDVLGKTLGEELLTPTKIYVKPILALLESFEIKAMAHITGGGFTENIPRVLPEGTQAVIDMGTWPILPVFTLVQELGKISPDDMFRTFNMGIGMVLVVKQEDADGVMAKLQQLGEQPYLIGRIGAGERKVVYNGVEW